MTRVGSTGARILTILVCVASVGQAQLELNGPNAALTLRGRVAHVEDPVGHDLLISVPGSLDLRIRSGVNPGANLILVASLADPSAPILTTPWGGSIDVGSLGLGGVPTGITLLGDGIGMSHDPSLDQYFETSGGNPSSGVPASFFLPLGTPLSLNGARVAFQAIVADPTAPLGLDNTEVADANFVRRQRVVLHPPPGGTEVTFLDQHTFGFHGVAYPSVWVLEDGLVTFGGPGTLSGSGFTSDLVAWSGDRPSIAPFLADWSTGSGSLDGVLYDELSGAVRLAWGDPTAGGVSHAGAGDLNRFEVTLHLNDGANPVPGAFSVSQPLVDPTPPVVDYGRGLVGHTPGGSGLLVPPRDLDLHHPRSAAAGRAMLEEHDFAATNVSNHGWNGTGSLRGYNDFTRSWNGGGVDFTPRPALAIPGDQGYTSQSLGGLPPDDLGPLPARVAGGQLLTLTGVFFGFDPNADGSGLVRFVERATGVVLPAIVLGILDSSGSSGPLSAANFQPGPHRDGQAMLIVTPNFPAPGLYDLEVVFDSGLQATRTVAIAPAGGAAATYTLGAATPFVRHDLVVPVVYGGTLYPRLFIHREGYITFATGATGGPATAANVFGGWSSAPNPGVAVYHTALGSGGGCGPSTQYAVFEDPLNGTVRVLFDRLTTPLGACLGAAVCTFGSSGPGSLSLDYSGVVAAAPNPVVVGVTDGDPTMGANTDLSNGAGTGLASAVGTYGSPGPSDSVLEVIPAGTPIAAIQVTFLDVAALLWIIL